MRLEATKETAAGDTLQAPAIECRQVTKVYRSLWAPRTSAVCALREVSLSMDRGQIIGLIGPNGAGKSTLLNLMAGLIFPTRGSLRVCGHPARSYQARRRLGYMPEHPAFVERYSARAVLRYHAALLGLPEEALGPQVDKSIEELQMQDFADRTCAEFSQGMRQRLALAIATMSDPQVLLLDEPSNGLDPIGIIQLRDLLRQLRDRGTAIVISSHRLGELEKLTSQYLFIHRGRIVTIANHLLPGHAGRLHVELAPNSDPIARNVLSQWNVLDKSNGKLTIALTDPAEAPDIVSDLAHAGARITGVLLQRENIEEAFLRLCNEQEKPCEPTNC